MSPPLIGITTYGRGEDNRFYLPAQYVDAVRRAGGIPQRCFRVETEMNEEGEIRCD